ncbi:MAG: IS1634 family transposase [Phycisphaerales bacterium]|nr:IS1634 family transposase [Phycisphaerales bacterium]
MNATNDALIPAYTSTTLDHLGLVAGMVEELGLVEKIDSLISQDLSQRHVSLGVAIKAMILNGLGFAHRTLYLMPHFFRDKPVERLLGPGLTAEHLNDDTLGRALDAIHAFGVETFYYLIASGVVKQLGLGGAGGHLDATSFHVDGDYNSGDETAAMGVIHIRQGYSRDRRPDLNQVVLHLLVESQASIPLLMAPLGGNVNDAAGFRDTPTWTSYRPMAACATSLRTVPSTVPRPCVPSTTPYGSVEYRKLWD